MFEGVLVKMKSELQIPIQYYLEMKEDFIHLNQALDKTFQITFLNYECLNCGKNLPIYRQGFCKSCFLRFLKLLIGLCDLNLARLISA